MTTATSPSTVKQCRKCKEILNLEDFYRKNESKDGREGSCSSCRRKQMSAADKARYTTAARRHSHLWNTYLIDQSIYDHILLMQDGHCACCPATVSGRATDKYLIVDHDHKTGEIRGLLCHNCNIMLGSARDNLSTLQNGITYLSKFTRG
jgi:hypothetical protein